jgi:hypothetical protein
LEDVFVYFNQINVYLQNGEKNFYDCNTDLLRNARKCKRLLAKKSKTSTTFDQLLSKNRPTLLGIYEIWQRTTKVTLQTSIIDLFIQYFINDPDSVDFIFESTSLSSEILLAIKQDISKSNQIITSKLLNCLIIMLVNSNSIPRLFTGNFTLLYIPCFIPSLLSFSFEEFLKESDIIEFIFETIECDLEYLHLSINGEDVDSTEADDTLKILTNNNITMELNHNDNSQNDIRNESSNQSCIDLFVNLVLALNVKFPLPSQNPIINYIVSNQNNDYKLFSETLLNHFNFQSISFSIFNSIINLIIITFKNR